MAAWLERLALVELVELVGQVGQGEQHLELVR
jgi:hypothetical protein